MELSQDIRICLERQTLEDDFKIKEQSFDTSYTIPFTYFTKIENVVNKICKDKECFLMKAYVRITPKLNYVSTFVRQSFDIVITSIVNYDNVVVTSKEITIN